MWRENLVKEDVQISLKLTLAERASAPRITPPSYLIAIMVVYNPSLKACKAYTVGHVGNGGGLLSEQLLLELSETHHYIDYLFKIIKQNI